MNPTFDVVFRYSPGWLPHDQIAALRAALGPSGEQLGVNKIDEVPRQSYDNQLFFELGRDGTMLLFEGTLDRRTDQERLSQLLSLEGSSAHVLPGIDAVTVKYDRQVNEKVIKGGCTMALAAFPHLTLERAFPVASGIQPRRGHDTGALTQLILPARGDTFFSHRDLDVLSFPPYLGSGLEYRDISPFVQR